MTDQNPMFNSFSNDGSFLEMFKKLQDEKQKSEAPSTTTTSTALPPVNKSKPVVMKLTAMKRKNPFLAKPIGVRDKAFSQGEASDEDNAGPSKPGERADSKMTEGVGSSPKGNTKASGADGTAKSVVLSDSAAKPSSLSSASPSSTTQITGKKRKRSRWSDAPPPQATLSEDEKMIASAMASFSQEDSPNPLTTSQQCMTPAQLQQLQEQIEMNKLVARIRAVTQEPALRKKKDPEKVQYEYDSDEDTEGGTWEHKKRAKEMLATFNKAIELTEMAKGKHHIGDFLPPEELERFLEKVQAVKEGRDPDFSDYKEHKLDDTNIGFRMLLNAGWSEGKGLGEKEEGIVNPINKGKTSFDQAGIGAETSTEIAKNDDAFDTYRKRMMLAYKFRPNPLNNPRRPYY